MACAFRRDHLRLVPATGACHRATALAATAVLMLATVNVASASPAGGSVEYRNPKYGFSLRIPSDVLKPGTPRNPEEGGLWTSHDGQARLIAVAAPNTSGETLLSYRRFIMRESYGDAAIDYAPVGGSWFVLSGVKEGRIFYERINLVCGGRYIYGWQLLYPVAERARYDRVVEAIHRSYRPGRGEDGACGQGRAQE